MTQIPPMQPPMMSPPPGQQGYGMGYAPPPPQKPQGLAITSMILGILSIVICCFRYLSLPLGIVAIVLAVIARSKIARGEAGGRGMATAGLITGIIGTLLSLVLVITGLVAGPKLMDWAQQQQQKAIQQQQQQQQQNSTTEKDGSADKTTDDTSTEDAKDTTESAPANGNR